MSELKVMNQQLEKARSAKEVFSIDFVADRSIKNYEAVTGRKDGNNWYQGEVLAMIKLFGEKPDYAKADRLSIWGCIMESARKGLSIADGHMDIIPYNKGAILKAEPNYKGLRKQLRDMPEIKFIHEAQVVFEGDKFLHDKLNNKVVEHVSGEIPKKMNLDNIKAAYIRIEWTNGHVTDVVMYNPELKAAYNKSKNKGEGSVWDLFTAEMCKKSVAKRANKVYYHRNPAELTDDIFKQLPKLSDEPETVDTAAEVVTPPVAEEPAQEVPVMQAVEVAAPEPVKAPAPRKKFNPNQLMNEE